MTQATQVPQTKPRKVAVNTHNEWAPMKSMVVGIATGAQIPTVKDESMHAINYGNLSDEQFARVRVGPFSDRIIAEANEDLDKFAEDLTAMGIEVHRPAPADFTQQYSTPDWTVDGYYAYCPRDTIFTIGNEAIESPMVLRHRQTEARLYRHFLDTVQAPVPRLLDSMYDRSVLGRPTLCNHEPAFDAANLLKCGRDILFLISNTGNEAGAAWLQEHLGSDYRVHPVRDVYAYVHVDSSIIPLRPGLVLLCPDRVREDNIPKYLKSWDRIWAPEPVEFPYDPEYNPSSKWIAMNIMSLRPDLAVVEEHQTNLMRELAKWGIDSYPIRLRHMRTMGGGPHCVTLDLVRESTLEDYSR